LSHRLQKGIVKTEHWSYALKLIFTSEKSKEEFLENAYCQMLFYPSVKQAELKSTQIYRVKKVASSAEEPTKSEVLLVNIPRPRGEIQEIAINFYDMYGYLICTHNSTI